MVIKNPFVTRKTKPREEMKMIDVPQDITDSKDTNQERVTKMKILVHDDGDDAQSQGLLPGMIDRLSFAERKVNGSFKEHDNVSFPAISKRIMKKERIRHGEKLTMIPFNKPPYFPESFSNAMQTVIANGKFSSDGICTEYCTDFFKERYGYNMCLLTPSCTAALEIAALLLDLGPSDEVIVPSFTFVTSASAFALRGVKLIFADSEKDHPNVSVDDISKKITHNTKAIIVVHYAGVPVDVIKIKEKTNGLIPIVEDCAHAIDMKDTDVDDYIGKQGCLAAFSFHETKNIGIGEGGLLVVNDPKLWKKAQIIREKGTNRTDFLAGRAAFYTWIDLGSSYCMSDIDACMLWSNLQNIEAIQNKRLGVWDSYDHGIIVSPECVFKKPCRSLRANAHMYFLEFYDKDVRAEFCNAMKEANILVATHYLPLDTSPYVQTQRGQGIYPEGEPCANAERWSNSLVRLPLFADISAKEVSTVIAEVNTFAENKSNIKLVAADEEHWEAIRQLRNENRHSFTQKKLLTNEEHWNFMQKHSSTYRVAIQNARVVGFIGHVNKDVRLATLEKGKGIAQYMWKSFEKEVGQLNVKVLLDNKRSLAFFKKLGYVPSDKSLQEGQNPVVLERQIRSK